VTGLLGGVLGVIEIGVRPYWTITLPFSMVVRWDALAAGLVTVAAIVLAAWLARTLDRSAAARTLHAEDLIYIVIAVLPGAIIGGRLVHGLAFIDVYSADPGALLDPTRGTLSMLGAVVGGTISGMFVAHVLGAPWRRWLDVAAPVLLLTIAGAKFAQFLGGGGQGLPFDQPWAVAFLGDGPWTSPMPGTPAHPAQLYEAFWALAGLLIVSVIGFGRLRHGLLYLVALSWWLVGRFVIGFTWRDEVVVGPLRAEQAMALAALVVAALLAVAARRRRPARTAPVDPVPVIG
jgi:prolipoprotein diacylglyceryltransferase